MDPIRPSKSLMELTSDRIREAIISGAFPLGSKLSEQRIADRLQISRSPVREALAMLKQEGLVEVVSKVGSFVVTPSLKSAEDLCDHRAILEAACIERAIERNQGPLLKGLRHSMERMAKAIAASDPVAYTQSDMQFHSTIIHCSENGSIISAYGNTVSPLMALRTHVFAVKNVSPVESMQDHATIIRLCEGQEVDAVKTVIRAHIFRLRDHYRSAQDARAGECDTL